MLFQAMQHFSAKIIAFAHHADDQVETAVMRKTQGSSIRGLAAMRPVRRWGMGHRENDYYAFGSEGMRSWIVRPFLQVSKVGLHELPRTITARCTRKPV